jgi:hypothetical protein
MRPRMVSKEILFTAEGQPITPAQISQKIARFGNGYNDAANDIIRESEVLGEDGEVFFKCASRILSSFGMTRSGPFHANCDQRLRGCWDAIGKNLVQINKSVRESGLSRDRYIVELSEPERKDLIVEIWLLTKRLLPFTMGGTSYGLVGASKILFSVLPEITLPIDNAQWLHVFKTVDIGDVLHQMVFDIQRWESVTGRRLNDLDSSKKLTTLPSVYNAWLCPLDRKKATQKKTKHSEHQYKRMH